MSKHTGIWTVGIDVGDRSSFYCLLDERGEIAAEGQFRSTKEGLRQQFGAMQAGFDCPGGRRTLALDERVAG